MLNLFSFLLLKMHFSVSFTGISFANTIQPLSSEKHVFRGEKVTLSCNYSGNVDNLQWYRQYPGSRPEHLILVTEYSEPDLSLHLSAKASKDLKQVNLTISSAEETDSALYYCALKPTVTGKLKTLYKNLP
uniref:Ig-like domain-containing protein n=1 Tax=Cyprinus carpio TaxID=7962 RepID=A0A8C1JXK8_CYPCA